MQELGAQPEKRLHQVRKLMKPEACCCTCAGFQRPMHLCVAGHVDLKKSLVCWSAAGKQSKFEAVAALDEAATVRTYSKPEEAEPRYSSCARTWQQQLRPETCKAAFPRQIE